MLQRQRKAQAVEREAELLFPERGEARPQAGIGHDDCNKRRQQQQNARRRSPAREVERSRAHPVAEPAEHRIGEGAFVPRSVVAAAVDEKGRRDQRAARLRAALVRVHPGLRPQDSRIVWRAGVGGNPKVVRHCLQIILGQGLRARHQLDVRVPEAFGILGALHELGGAAGKLDADERPMPEDVAQAIAELIAHFRDPLVGRAAIGAGVAPVFDESDVCIRGAENVVELFVHRPIEPIASRHVRHASFLAPDRITDKRGHCLRGDDLDQSAPLMGSLADRAGRRGVNRSHGRRGQGVGGLKWTRLGRGFPMIDG